MANPQALNRFSYVLGNPLLYVDPSGHAQCRTKEDCEDMGTTSMGGNTGPTPPIPPAPSKPEDYNGPIPDEIIDQLVLQGADLDFLLTVTIHNNKDDEWKTFCYPGAAAVTWYSTIYYCEASYFDAKNPTGTLLHELIHVTQFLKYPEDVLEELDWIADLRKRDRDIAWWNDNWPGAIFGPINIGPYDPYQYSWVEVQASNCGDAYRNNPGIVLDRPPCNLAP